MTNPIYRSRAWTAARKRCLQRDGGMCQIGYRGCLGRANSADHIVELEDGGAPYDLSNLQAACVPCNVRKMHAAKKARLQRLRRQVRNW